jgi:hypothetical protein
LLTTYYIHMHPMSLYGIVAGHSIHTSLNLCSSQLQNHKGGNLIPLHNSLIKPHTFTRIIAYHKSTVRNQLHNNEELVIAEWDCFSVCSLLVL